MLLPLEWCAQRVGLVDVGPGGCAVDGRAGLLWAQSSAMSGP